ncbi:ATP-binding protein [Streptomyces sp.]|uniref:ATP-binding protein n=1 Tax=Streptomyces sp. TaxID=1931 RepID=UPI002D76CAF3|nr:ATP-binding protein [Streptomyces sp.]HET6355109.1 ATP-binding protein [Streptomyces sp.]
MIYANECVRRKPWDLSFEAEPREVAGLRRVLRLHLTLWGLPELVEAAQICVTELTSNVIKHVGVGTPATLAVSMSGTRLRIELRDPDARALPTLLSAECEAESGRGMTLVDAVTDQWGVILRADSKVVWCELATNLTGPNGHTDSPRVAHAEEYLRLYGTTRHPRPSGSGRLSVAAREEAAIDLISDVLHWLRAHGCDPDEALDRAQTHFEAERGEA